MVDVEMCTPLCGGHDVVALREELDAVDAGSAVAAVAALAAGGQQLIIDLEAREFIDCHAVGALLGVRKAARGCEMA
jgi:anti-anti-sigma regulatory factor